MLSFSLVATTAHVVGRWGVDVYGEASVRPGASRFPPISPRLSPRITACLAEGDHVLVVRDVRVKGHRTALGMTGCVLDTCEREADEWGCCMQVETDAPIAVQLEPSIEGYFQESELELLEGQRDVASSPRELREGCRVRVKEEVIVRGHSSKGAVGYIVDAWEICETDPACCCAELAAEATITVRLPLWQREGRAQGGVGRGGTTKPPLIGYFAPDELAPIRDGFLLK